MPYGEGEAFGQDDFARMFQEKQGYDNEDAVGADGQLGQLLLQILMQALSQGNT